MSRGRWVIRAAIAASLPAAMANPSAVPAASRASEVAREDARDDARDDAGAVSVASAWITATIRSPSSTGPSKAAVPPSIAMARSSPKPAKRREPPRPTTQAAMAGDSMNGAKPRWPTAMRTPKNPLNRNTAAASVAAGRPSRNPSRASHQAPAPPAAA